MNMTFKSVAVRFVLLVVGFGIGMLLFLLCSFILGFVGMPPGYALYNGYFLAIVLWIVGAGLAYLYTRNSGGCARWNLATFMVGVLAFPLMGGVAMLIQEPQYIVFLPGR
jgi:hypothetical protein